MGFLDTIKNAALKVKCAAGFHGGSYTPIEGLPKCNLEKDCPDCGKHITVVEHSFPEEKYKNAHSCVKSTSCIHCGEVSERMDHENYEEIDIDDHCRVKERCTRCNHEKTGNVRHTWAKNAHNSTDTHVEYWCVRCSKSEMREKKSF